MVSADWSVLFGSTPSSMPISGKNGANLNELHRLLEQVRGFSLGMCRLMGNGLAQFQTGGWCSEGLWAINLAPVLMQTCLLGSLCQSSGCTLMKQSCEIEGSDLFQDF